MKNLRIILLTLLWVGGGLVAMAQSPVYDKYNEMKNVSSVYISKTMLDMDPNLYTNDLYIGKVAGQLDAVYMLSTMMGDIRKNMKKDIDDYIKKNKYELLMKQQGIVSGSSFYMKKKGDRVRELIMITDGSAKLSFVHLVGNLTLEDIQRITRESQASLDGYQFPNMEELKEYLKGMDSEEVWRQLAAVDVEKLKADIWGNIDFEALKVDFEALKECMGEINFDNLKLDQIDFSKIKEFKDLNFSWVGESAN